MDQLASSCAATGLNGCIKRIASWKLEQGNAGVGTCTGRSSRRPLGQGLQGLWKKQRPAWTCLGLYSAGSLS